MKISRKGYEWTGYLFILPLLVLFSIFLVYSIFFIVRNSFFDVDISFIDFEYVGLENYRMLFEDARFIRSIVNTLIFAVVSVVAGMTLGFFIAIAVKFKFRGVNVLHSLFFAPSLMPMVLVATVFSMMFEYRNGTLNVILRSLNLDILTRNWLSDPLFSYVSIIFVLIYLIGIPIMYYTAGLATIDSSFYEAASIDGANMIQIITKVIFPSLATSHKTVILTLLLGTFRAFEVVFMTTGGGPVFKTDIVGTYLYSYSTSGTNVGYISAASLIVLILAFIIAMIQLKISSRNINL